MGRGTRAASADLQWGHAGSTTMSWVLIPLIRAALRIDPPDSLREPEPASTSEDLTLAELERRHVLATLERCRWRVRGAGGAGISPNREKGCSRRV